MKKCILFVVIFALIMLAGCNQPQTEQPTTEAVKATVEATAQSTQPESIAPFTDIAWTRETEQDAETIRFGADGSFSYSCACGDPVNDADLCEGYTYDEAARTITLSCIESTDEMITVIQVVKCDGQELHLDFAGEIRIFTQQ